MHTHKSKRRAALVVLAVLVLGLASTACQPEEIAKWTEVVHQRQSVQMHPFLVCVRHHESDRSVYPYIKGYRAVNPDGDASGAYQFKDATWRTVAVKSGNGYYANMKAMYAPDYVQDDVALWTFQNIGRSPWYGTGC